MAQKVIVPQKKNYVPQFLKQRDINSYFLLSGKVSSAYNILDCNCVQMQSKNFPLELRKGELFLSNLVNFLYTVWAISAKDTKSEKFIAALNSSVSSVLLF